MVSPQKQSCRTADNLTANLQIQIRQVYYHIRETENWRILLKAAGIETLEVASNATRRQKYRNSSEKLCSRHIGRYSYHSFRHTFCTIAANAGKDLAIIRSIVGHANIQMTSHYTHYSLESKRQVIESLPLPQRTIAKPPLCRSLYHHSPQVNSLIWAVGWNAN